MKNNKKYFFFPLGYFSSRSPLIIETGKNGTEVTT